MRRGRLLTGMRQSRFLLLCKSSSYFGLDVAKTRQTNRHNEREERSECQDSMIDSVREQGNGEKTDHQA